MAQVAVQKRTGPETTHSDRNALSHSQRSRVLILFARKPFQVRCTFEQPLESFLVHRKALEQNTKSPVDHIRPRRDRNAPSQFQWGRGF
ncbi:unnamed protein product [Caenorhabditis auriculariae]|uniref:Uncharacterized protein n=1 Tax=Caenorhabditis auriculariae TaxID=2777116 RepID=A0A8S1GTH7_9PELO|nr:unnamed protein product [Caenorhabditis auriculariae]